MFVAVDNDMDAGAGFAAAAVAAAGGSPSLRALLDGVSMPGGRVIRNRHHHRRCQTSHQSGDRLKLPRGRKPLHH